MPSTNSIRKFWPAGLALVILAAGLVWQRRHADGEPPVPMHALEVAAFQPTIPHAGAPAGAGPAGMVWIPGGEFSMGAAEPTGEDHNAVGMHATDDARPAHRVSVDGFWMDATEVTNDEFARFVEATQYVTVAERQPRPEDFPGAPVENLVPGLSTRARARYGSQKPPSPPLGLGV